LLFSAQGRFWVHLLASGSIPTHFAVFDASTGEPVGASRARLVTVGVEDVGPQLVVVASDAPALAESVGLTPELVAEVQEAEQWDDYRPASSRYFVGRKEIRSRLYQFVLAVREHTVSMRVFFLEGKSGWGKSSLVADLRSRARNRRNRKMLFCYAVDCRSALSSSFPALAFAKMLQQAGQARFIPADLSKAVISSSTGVLESDQVKRLLEWLTQNRRVLVLVFDQFEDIFRKTDLFRSFHHLMSAAGSAQANLVIGFSWKSEIHIPIDNPAYHLWQQARTNAESFLVGEFDSGEVSAVIRQLEAESRTKLQFDLWRRLVEVSQGFPWLIKKLAIHCYRQFKKGMTPEELVDQDLNAQLLFLEDMEGLDTDTARALNYIAKRAYEGDAFDVVEIDDKIPEAIINSLLSRRLVIRSGSKYNAYWDIFQEYLVTNEVPRLGESFLLRQYPRPCIDVLRYVITKGGRAAFADLRSDIPRLSEGTLLNRVRELRHLGLLLRESGEFAVRPSVGTMEDADNYIRAKLDAHVVISDLRRSTPEVITHRQVRDTLRARYRTYRFSAKTWGMYASYMMAWMRYANIDLGGRLSEATTHDPQSFTPQMTAPKVVAAFLALPFREGSVPLTRDTYKLVYDLKALGLVTYSGGVVHLTRKGRVCYGLPRHQAEAAIAKCALETVKIAEAVRLVRASPDMGRAAFAERLSPVLREIRSSVYRSKTVTVLRSWAELVVSYEGSSG
jgi:hypothetical protein